MKARRSFLAVAAVLLTAISLRGSQTLVISESDRPLLENRELGAGTGLIGPGRRGGIQPAAWRGCCQPLQFHQQRRTRPGPHGSARAVRAA